MSAEDNIRKAASAAGLKALRYYLVYDGMGSSTVVDKLSDAEVREKLSTQHVKELNTLINYGVKTFSFYYDDKGNLNLYHRNDDQYGGLG